MIETQSSTPSAFGGDSIDGITDVFAAARWFGSLWNSSARAVSVSEIEWQCNTWGSGRGRGDWLDSAVFLVVARAFAFRSWVNHDERDELVVLVPLERFHEVARVIDRLGDEPECWPWFDEELEDDIQGQIAAAAEVLKIPTAALDTNTLLLAALRIA